MQTRRAPDRNNPCLPGSSPGAILLRPIHLRFRAARAGVLGLVCVCVSLCVYVSEGFRIGDVDRKGSFEEVTDEVQGTGQRKFTRCWCGAAERNFSSPSAPAAPWIGDERIHRRWELLCPRHTSNAEE